MDAAQVHAAQCLHQHRLELVVRMVRQRQRAAARLAVATATAAAATNASQA